MTVLRPITPARHQPCLPPRPRKHVLDRVGHALHSTHTLTPTHILLVAALLAPYKLYHHINVRGSEGGPVPLPLWVSLSFKHLRSLGLLLSL